MKQKPRPLNGFHRRNVRENKPAILWPKTRHVLEQGKEKVVKKKKMLLGFNLVMGP